jgi:hypothetical protein
MLSIEDARNLSGISKYELGSTTMSIVIDEENARHELPDHIRRSLHDAAIARKEKAEVQEFLENDARSYVCVALQRRRVAEIERQTVVERNELIRQESLRSQTDAVREWVTNKVIAPHSLVDLISLWISALVALADIMIVVLAAATYVQASGLIPSVVDCIWYAAPYVFVFASTLVGAKWMVESAQTNDRRRQGRRLMLITGLLLSIFGFAPQFAWVFNLASATVGSSSISISAGHLEAAQPAIALWPSVIMAYCHVIGAALVGAGLWLAVIASANENHQHATVVQQSYRTANRLVDGLRVSTMDLVSQAGVDQATIELAEAQIKAIVAAGLNYYEALIEQSRAIEYWARIRAIDLLR